MSKCSIATKERTKYIITISETWRQGEIGVAATQVPGESSLAKGRWSSRTIYPHDPVGGVDWKRED